MHCKRCGAQLVRDGGRWATVQGDWLRLPDDPCLFVHDVMYDRYEILTAAAEIVQAMSEVRGQ